MYNGDPSLPGRWQYRILRWVQRPGFALQKMPLKKREGHRYVLRTPYGRRERHPSATVIEEMIAKGWLNPRSLMATPEGIRVAAEVHKHEGPPKWLAEGIAQGGRVTQPEEEGE